MSADAVFEIMGSTAVPEPASGWLAAAFLADTVEMRIVPSALISQAQAFAQAWVTEQNIGRAIDSVNTEVLREQFVGLQGRMGALSTADPFSVGLWAKRLLTMYLVEDHEAVNFAGHGDVESQNYDALPESPQPAGAFRARPPSSAPRLTPANFMPFTTQTSSLGNLLPWVRFHRRQWALALRFDELPHNALVVIWKYDGGKWFIARMLPTII